MLMWRQGQVPQRWRDAVLKVLYKKKGRTYCKIYRGISLVAHAGKVLLKIVAMILGGFCEIEGLCRKNSAGPADTAQPWT